MIAKPRTLYDEIAESHPSLLRGRVWCTRCSSFRQVNAADALRNGWPRCCGATMTIDSPAEQAAARTAK